jgi:plastocyanin
MKTATLLASILVVTILLFGCTQQPAPAQGGQTPSVAATAVATQQAAFPTASATQQAASPTASASVSALSCSGTENGFKLSCSDQPPAGAGCEVKSLGERSDCKFPSTCFAVKCPKATPSPTPFFASPSPAATGVLSGQVTIHISNFAFNPAEVTITGGTRVTWVNDDSVSHTVTSEGGRFAFPDSATLSWNQQYSNVFVNMGTYNYHCNIHPSMKGKIIVVE